MKVSNWTSNGREIINITDAGYAESVIKKLRELVREASYNLMILEADDDIKGYSFSRAANLRQLAIDALRTFDLNAEEFIKKTYQPKTFLHS